jgi:hypothetical protein
MSFALSKLSQAAVNEYAHEPGGQARSTAEAVDIHKGSKQSLLNSVFGILSILQDMKCRSVETRTILAIHSLKSLLVSASQLAQQERFCVARCKTWGHRFTCLQSVYIWHDSFSFPHGITGGLYGV